MELVDALVSITTTIMTTNITYASSFVIDQSGSRFPTGQTHPIFIDSIEKPLRERRKKPADLFANSTSRRVESVITKYTNGTFGPVRPWPGYSIEAPLSYWAVTSHDAPISEPSVADFASLDNRARGKIKDQNVNLANALAEYRQTSGLLLETARDVIRTFHSLRSGRALKDFTSMLAHPETRNARNLSNRWLQYQYGWRPLLSDVKGSAEALAKTIETGSTHYQTVKETLRDEKTTPFILGDSISKVTLQKKVRVRYVISSMGAKTLSETGFSNPLSVAWEVVPWSFVIDWMLPIGDFLNGLDALCGVSQLCVVRSYKYQVVTNQTLTYADAYNAFSTQPTGFSKLVVTNRFAANDQLSFGNLSFEPSLTRTRVANAMALLRQLKR